MTDRDVAKVLIVRSKRVELLLDLLPLMLKEHHRAFDVRANAKPVIPRPVFAYHPGVMRKSMYIVVGFFVQAVQLSSICRQCKERNATRVKFVNQVIGCQPAAETVRNLIWK